MKDSLLYRSKTHNCTAQRLTSKISEGSERLLRTGGQKSKQEKKEAHKAKRRAKKGTDAADASALSKEAPTAAALAAVGASQMSQAAADRQAQVDRNKVAWQQRTQGVAPTPAAASGEAETSTQHSGEHVDPRHQAGDLQPGIAAESSPSAEEASSSSSEAEEDGSGDVANGAQVWIVVDCFTTYTALSSPALE